MSFPRYPAYKDSGIAWLKSIPSHWAIVQLRHLADCLDGQRIPLNSAERSDRKGDVPYWGANSVQDHIDAHLFDEELVLLGEDGAPFFDKTKPVAFRSEGRIWPNNHIHVLRPRIKGDSAFLTYCLNATDFADYVDGSTRDKLTQSAMNRIAVTQPSEDERTAIVHFLDRETAKIDALVAEQEQLITLLKEKRQAVISHAVTKGLDLSVPMKNSGIEWLGEVPAHWEVVRVKHLVKSFEQGWSPQCENFPVESASDWGVLKVGCVNGGIFNPEENKALPADLTPLPELGISSGDLLISRANTRELVGSAAVALVNHQNLMLCDKLYRLRLDPALCLPAFLSLFLGTERARGQIELAATGASSSMLNISQSTILDMCLALPPVAEQQELLHKVDESATQFDQLIDEAVLSIELLRERRSALISAAVTGQIDVRGLLEQTEKVLA